MADNQNQQGDQNNQNNNAAGGGGQSQVTFTPEQQLVLDRMFAERGEQGRKSGITSVLKEIGVENLDTLKAMLAEADKLKKAQLSETEQLKATLADVQKKLDAESEKAKNAQMRATETLLRAAVIAEALKQNIDESELASVWMALQSDKTLRDSIKAKGDTDEFDGVEAAVKKIAEQHPRWVKSQVPPPPPNLNSQAAGRQSTASNEQLLAAKRSQYAGTI